MIESHLAQIVSELSLQPRQVTATALLLEEGGTVPFIARYRKERTGELDEVQITAIRDRLAQLAELDKRREAITSSLSERSLLTEDLKNKLAAAKTVTTLEDIYLPFRPKKRTRAIIARERGLEPLADLLWAQNPTTDPSAEAAEFVDVAKEVADPAAALAGARDILAERMSDDATTRARLRELFLTKGELRSRMVPDKETEGAKFKDYFDWTELAANAPSHRILAIRRGETEGFLYSRIVPPEVDALAILENQFVKNTSPAAAEVRAAAHDAYKRLLCFAMEGEARMQFKKRADEEAIRVFAENLRELLLASPLGGKNTLAIDPGFRTGCKVVLLDRQGKLLGNEVIYLEKSQREREQAATLIRAAVEKFHVEAIAIGNGTGSRETETFIRALGLPASIAIVTVNESGASIYSASEIAREEFPDYDLTVRGAVSIGRRLMDPLAELVKLDPKSIGVGQYQHDVDQTALKHSLDDVVVSCVNSVGVELNTASKHLLTYVSGLNSRTAASLVAHRDSNGPFRSRKELLAIPGLGPKAFEQAAGFLRIRDSVHPLDASAVHPERYDLVEKMAADLGCDVASLMRDASRTAKIPLEKYVTADVGVPTLRDILAELTKPGRDPRKQFELFQFAEGVEKIEHLRVGMKLPGIVTNVTAFGAFVDVGVHQDGLVHISQLADQFVKAPADVVKVGQRVRVSVVEVDLPRKRIALSMKQNPETATSAAPRGAGGPPANRAQRRAESAAPARNAARSGNEVDWFTAAMNKKN